MKPPNRIKSRTTQALYAFKELELANEAKNASC